MQLSCPICRSACQPRHLGSFCSAGCRYELVHCRTCDLMFWNPPSLPAEFSYASLGFGIYDTSHGSGHEELSAHQRAFPRRYRGPRGRLLDVGCSDGNFLRWAQSNGFEVYGVDIDSVALQHARRITPRVWLLTLAEFAEWASGRGLRFDVITFFDVLEHQPQPLPFLRSAARLLVPGGWIAGTVPNRRRLLKTGRSACEAFWDLPPHHFLWFNAGALRSALVAGGLNGVEVQCQMYGYATPEILRLAGYPVKRFALGRPPAGAGLKAPSPVLPPHREWLFRALRHAKQVAEVLPQAMEAGVERLARAGGSLYFQGRRDVD